MPANDQPDHGILHWHISPKMVPPRLLHFARSLRSGQTNAETRLWLLLRARRIDGMKFRRQHAIPPYVVDFYCHDARLAVELDGGQHSEMRRYDDKRTAFLKAHGMRVLRFWNNEVLEQTEAVLEAIWHALHEPPHLP